MKGFTEDAFLKVSLKNHKVLKSAGRVLKDHFGIDYFYYISVNAKGHYSFFANEIDWNKYSFQNELYCEIPHYFQPKNFPKRNTLLLPFLDTNFSTVADIAKHQYGINIILEIRENDGKEMKGFGFSSSSFSFDTFTNCISELSLLKFFIKQFKEQHGDIFDQLEENRIDIASAIGPQFWKFNHTSFKSPSHFLRNLGFNIFSDLSEREKEISTQIVKGHSAHQIAMGLKLSQRTVEHYIENMKEKLNCHTKSELISKCLVLESSQFL